MSDLNGVAFIDCDGTMTDNTEWYSGGGERMKGFNHSDGMGIEMLKNAGIEVYCISGEFAESVMQRCSKLNIRYIWTKDKREKIQQTILPYLPSHIPIGAIGNDINDFDMLMLADFAAAPADHFFDSGQLEAAEIVVMKRNGGHGAVREFAEDFLWFSQALLANRERGSK